MSDSNLKRRIQKSLSRLTRRHKGALAASICVTVVVTILSVIIQSYIRDLSQQAAAKSLTTVAETTEEALVAWFEREKEKARIYADRPEIRAFARRLLLVKRQQEDLLSSAAQTEQRDWLASDLAANRHLGFFLVAPDGVNIASARDANVGQRNLLMDQGEFLQRILNGETQMSLPVRSDVPLADENGMLISGVPTMFVGAPVRDETSAVITILLFRIDPKNDFIPILKRGRIGTSGETYAFDGQGRMLSVSRFFGQLLAMGILDQDASDSLGVAIRDPGVNLVNGGRAQASRRDQPLTLMAQNATSMVDGRNLVGYRDYRGVPVIGVWRWIDKMNLGITSEIDVDEVYELSRNYQTMIRTAAALIVLMSISIFMISASMRGRVVADHARYRNLFNKTNDAIVVADGKTWQIIDANEQALTSFQYSREEIQKKRIRDLHPSSESAAFRGKLAEIETQGHVMFEANLQRKDGSTYQGEISASIAELEEGVVIQAFVRDITDKKILEAELSQAQRIRAIGTLAGGVAHDFNNLLLPIIGNAQLIAANVDTSSKLATYAERIVTAGKRGSRLVVQLLTLGSGTEPEQTEVDLPFLVHEAVRLIHSIVPQSVKLTTDIDDACGVVKANADQIHQIIMNLAINAIHAMEGGVGVLHIALRSFEEEPGVTQKEGTSAVPCYAELSVSDTGCGMDEEVRGKIFDPFFSTKEHDKGTGLGLSTVRDILSKHSGTITVTSKVDSGSTFKIVLPCIVPQALAPGVVGANLANANEHILVVDDDVENTLMIADMLEQIGYSVSTANSGEEALKLIRGGGTSFDLVITDFAMPHMNGDELAQHIRTSLPAVPVVIMTGFAVPLAEKRREMAEGQNQPPFAMILGKPFSSEELGHTIRECLERSFGGSL